MDRQEIKILIQEVKDIKGKEILTKNQKIAFEQKILKDLKDEVGNCQKCGRIENLTLDHVVPSFFLKMFGLDIERDVIEDNYQLLCRLCNQFKGGQLDFSNSKTKEILLRLLEKV